MFRSISSKLAVIMLLMSVSFSAFNIRSVRADGPVYIRTDGSVDPPTAPIQRDGNVYTLTGNITADASGIVVERDNVKLDGAGYTILGSGLETGIDVSNRENVTIENTRVGEFYFGIFLNYSDNCGIRENTLTHNGFGIPLVYSCNNVLRNNTLVSNTHALALYGISPSDYVNDVDSSNTVDGKPVCYWIDAHERQVPLDAGYVCLVNCSGITVQNLNLSGNGEGIMLAYTAGSMVTQNNMTYNGDGIRLYSSNNNAIIANNMTTNRSNGLLLWRSSNNEIAGNRLTSMWGSGIFLYDSSDSNSISGNNMTANLYGMTVISSNNNSVFENSFVANSDHAGIGLRYSNSNRLFENNITNNLYGIALGYSNDNDILGNKVITNEDGIYLWSSCIDNNVSRNTIAENSVGIALNSSSSNSIVDNNITANNECGISLEFSSSNEFYRNEITDNAYEVRSYYSTNAWDDGYSSGGNYWSGYNGTDSKGDGIGDTPYIIDANNTDHYPLISPYWYWSNPASCDMNRDMKVDMKDVGSAAACFGSRAGDPKWNPRADVTADGKVDIKDLVAIAKHFGEHYS